MATSALGYALLCALHRAPLTGYELVQRMRRPIGYYWSAHQSQIYPELARLAEQGLISSSGEPGPGPHQRTTHRLTEAGRTALAEWLPQPARQRAPRNELVLKTYALAAADPRRMRELYLSTARQHEETLREYLRQRAEMRTMGADDPGHERFGAYATLEYGIAGEEHFVDWCRWMADRMAARFADPVAGAGEPPS